MCSLFAKFFFTKFNKILSQIYINFEHGCNEKLKKTYNSKRQFIVLVEKNEVLKELLTKFQ